MTEIEQTEGPSTQEPTTADISEPRPAAASAGRVATLREDSLEMERAKIEQRVTAFREHQIQMRLQREAYYNATLSRARAALAGNRG